jgi:hypothetical protein
MKSPHGKTRFIGASTMGEVLQRPDYEDEIVLYDGGLPCTASRMACRFLKAHG